MLRGEGIESGQLVCLLLVESSIHPVLLEYQFGSGKLDGKLFGSPSNSPSFVQNEVDKFNPGLS